MNKKITGRVYGWEGSLAKEEVVSDNLSPWITPLLVHPDDSFREVGLTTFTWGRPTKVYEHDTII